MTTNDRNEIYGRIIALADAISLRVFDKDAPSIAALHLDRLAKWPAKTLEDINQRLMQYAHKFGPREMALFDLMGEQIARLDLKDFTNEPLDAIYLKHYYTQKADRLVGVAEAAELLGWKKQKVATYITRGVFPEPIQRLASGPIWLRSQIETYKSTKEAKENGTDY